MRQLMKATSYLQAHFRGALVRSRFRNRLDILKEISKRFQAFWVRALQEREQIILISNQSYKSWETLKELRCDFAVPLDLVDDLLFSERQLKLSVATEHALEDLCEYTGSDDGSECSQENDCTTAVGPTVINKSREAFCFERIKLTKEVVKWLRVADTKYKEFFVRRMKQLSAGTCRNRHHTQEQFLATTFYSISR